MTTRSRLVRIKGEFVWHTHDDTDELFLVIDGVLTIQLRDGDVTLRPGQLFVVPRGVEHCPIADGEVQAMLIEPSGVVNTGDAGGRSPLSATTAWPRARVVLRQSGRPRGGSTVCRCSRPAPARCWLRSCWCRRSGARPSRGAG